MSDFLLIPFLEKYFSGDEYILLACSGGADSMFLLHHILQSSYKSRLVIMHVNHCTRVECIQEQQALEEIAKKHGCLIEICIYDFSKNPPQKSMSFEEYARQVRYDFFQKIGQKYHTPKILLAHHLDDRIETMMFHIMRGTKLRGLINMQEKSGDIYRPLLSIEKREILDYLSEHHIRYFEDKSNQDNTYTRNYLRNNIMPHFFHIHPEYKKNISQLLEYFEELHTYIKHDIETFLGTFPNSYFHIPSFLQKDIFFKKELISYVFTLTNNQSSIGLSQNNIAEVLRFISGKNNKTYKHIKNMYLFKDSDKLWYSSKNSTKT